MKTSPAFLAFDLGAESGRAVLGRLCNDRIELQEIHRFPNGPVRVDDSLYWDVLNLWQEMKHGLAFAVKEEGNSLISLGVDTWGVDFGLLDKKDNLIGNPYHYRDRRTEGMVEAVSKSVPITEIYQQTGIQIMAINSLYQLVSMVLSNSSQLTAARTFLNMPDLFNFWFSGVKASEYSIATTTQCYSQTSNNWAWDLLNRLEIPVKIFGDIVAPGTVLGNLRGSVSQEIGVGKINIVAVTSHDTQSTVAAIPAETDNYIYLSSGTWSLMGIEVDRPIITELSHSFELTNEGGYSGKFCLQKNIMGLWILQGCRREWAMNGQVYSYDHLTQMAASAPPFRSFINPADPSFIIPGDMTIRIQAFCKATKQPVPQTEAEVVRCIFESLALEYRRVVEQISSLSKRSLPVIHITGGGARNAVLNQFTANATGRRVIAGPVEATAMGNIMVQTISAGYVTSLAEGRNLIHRSIETHEFEPVDVTSWDEAYNIFSKLRKS